MELKQEYENTDTGIIPSGWELKSISEVALILDNLRRPLNDNARFKMRGDIPYCGANNIVDYVNDYIIDDDIILIAEDGGNFEQYKTRPIAYRMSGKCWVNNHAHILKAKKEYCQDYIFYTLVHKNILDYINGGTRAKLNKGELINIEIKIPTNINEQLSIAQTLSDIDAYIASLEKLIEKKKAIKQGVMQEMLNPKDGWQTKTLKEVATYRRGSFPQPYGLDKWYNDITGFPFVQVFDVDDNYRLKNETKRRISKLAQAMSVFVKRGSIILTIQGSIGRIAITQYDAYVDRTLLIFESFKFPFDSYFFMISIWKIFEVEKENAPGGIIKTITKEALSSFKITFPDINEQNRIASILSEIEYEILTLENKLEKVKAIKQGMMQNLITGKIRLL